MGRFSFGLSSKKDTEAPREKSRPSFNDRQKAKESVHPKTKQSSQQPPGVPPQNKPRSRSKPAPPPRPSYERPVLPPHTLMELRLACAEILRETGPSEEEHAIIVGQVDPLEAYKKEQQDIRGVREQASASQTSLQMFSPGGHSRRKDSKSLKDTSGAGSKKPKPLPDVLPITRPSKLIAELPASFPARKDSRKVPVPEHVESKSKSFPPRKDSYSQPEAPFKPTATSKKITRKPVSRGTSQGRQPIMPVARPRIGSAVSADIPVSLDYVVAPASGSNSRPTTSSNRANQSPKVSSRMASFAQARTSGEGEANAQHTALNPLARNPPTDLSAKAWIAKELDLRSQLDEDIRAVNPDYARVPTLYPDGVRPGSRNSYREPSQPQSRAGSVLGTIKNYMMPRPSMASSRNISRAASRQESRAGSRLDSRASSMSRPGSRGSSFSASGQSWLKGAAKGLRRKGSWRSFRSNRGGEEEQERGRKDSRPDLNRSLPPLPGLDQYKAPKEPKIHIAHLMATAPHSLPPLQTNISSREPGIVISSVKSSPKAKTPYKDREPLSASAYSERSNPRVPIDGEIAIPAFALASAYRESSKPRMPFDGDSLPPSGVQSLDPSREAGWLESEVSRRLLAAQHSPALTSSDMSPSLRPASQSEMARQREEAIRQIAMRPLPDRSTSHLNQEGEVRSLSALGYRERNESRTASALCQPSHTRSDAEERKVDQKTERDRGRLQSLEQSNDVDDDMQSESGVGTEVGSVRESGKAEKRGLKNRLSRLLGGHGGTPRAVVAN